MRRSLPQRRTAGKRRVLAAAFGEKVEVLGLADDVLAEFLRAQIEVPAPRTPDEIRAHRELVRRREYARCAARTWIGLLWNKRQYRLWRRLSKSLQRKGVIPPNETGR